MKTTTLVWTLLLIAMFDQAQAFDFKKRKDLPEIDESPLRGAVSWEGAYGGLDIGYAGGGNNSVRTSSFPLIDTLNNSVASQAQLTSPAVFGVSSLANLGAGMLNSAGVLGGLQIGYNMNFGPDLVTGVEADFQWSSISGTSSYISAPITQSAAYIIPSTNEKGTFTNTFLGRGSVTGNVNWLGTVRSRLGYLILPELMIYGTGGFAYGGVSSHATHSYVQSAVDDSNDGVTQTIIFYNALSTGGYGAKASVKYGWTGGGGFEWMFSPNWSLKAEGLYYDLGSNSMNTTLVGTLGSTANLPRSRVQYDGVIARGGLNYHLNYGGLSSVF